MPECVLCSQPETSKRFFFFSFHLFNQVQIRVIISHSLDPPFSSCPSLLIAVYLHHPSVYFRAINHGLCYLKGSGSERIQGKLNQVRCQMEMKRSGQRFCMRGMRRALALSAQRNPTNPMTPIPGSEQARASAAFRWARKRSE